MAVSDTLRGYRTQFLYTIYRVLTSKEKEQEVFLPEGEEDLDVLVEGRVKECIQVKNYLSGDVKYGNLQSVARTTSFFRRGINTLNINPNAKLVLFSYHGIDKVLTNKQKLMKKLSADVHESLKQKDVQRFVNAFETEQMNENALVEEITSILKQSFVASSPKIEIRYLTQWIYEIAEKKQSFTYKDLIDARLKFVCYLNLQKAAIKNLGVTVKNLNEVSQTYDKDVLLKNFRSGVSARMCHIHVGLDIIRTAKMSAIDDALRKSNIAVIHGVSGQGKSTLAYRYIFDCCPLAYEITNSNANNVDEIISTLSALVKDLRCKITFFMDVEPSNSEWIKVLAQFGESKYAQCIVAIRQEDLNQYRHNLDKTIGYSEVGLELTKEEARDIYNQISLSNCNLQPFAQVWDDAGIHGTMLEYMYRLTHGESLQARLAEQVSRISGSERKLLAYIVMGNYLGGHIRKENIECIDGIDILEALETMHHWIDEFYSLNAENCMTDVHPLRTKIIMDEIFHDNIKAKVKYGLDLYQRVRVNHVDTYLLRLMGEGMSPDELIQWANEHSELSPVHYYGIGKALYWKGIQDYLYKHEHLITELKDRVGELWTVYLPINFTGIDIYDNLRTLALQLNLNLPEVKDIINKFDHQTTIFKYLKKWMIGKTLRLNITCGNDWVKTGQLLYLLAQIGHKDIELFGSAEGIGFLDLQDMATVLLGLKSVPLYNFIDEFEEKFECKLRRTFHIVRFERSEQELYVKSFIDYFGKDDDADRKGFITERQNMKILDLCRRAFPNEQKYHAEILNDVVIGSFGDIPLEMNIAQRNLPLEEMGEPRKILINLHKRTYHPLNRTSYAQNVFNIREEYARIIFRIANGLEKWSIDKNKLQGIQAVYREALAMGQSNNILIPRSEISEYGYSKSLEISFSTFPGQQDQAKEQEFEKLHKLITEYVNNIQNFIRQSDRVLGGDVKLKINSLALLYDAFEGLVKMQTMYRELLNEYVQEADVHELEKKELSNIKLLWVLWEQFMKDSNSRLNSKMLLKQFEEKEAHFAASLIKNINEYIYDYLLIGHAESYGDKIRITYTYTDEYAKESNMEECIGKIRNILCDYEYFSSERLILSRKYEAVWLNPVLVGYGRFAPNMDSHYVSISINTLFDNSATTDLKKFPSYDVCTEMYEQNPRLESYISFLGHFTLTSMCIMKIQIAYTEVEDDDEIGMTIIDDYVKLCQRQIKESLRTFDDSEARENLLIGEQFHDTIINRAISCLDRFKMEIIDTVNWWNQSSELLDTMHELMENDWVIKTALVKADDY